MNRNIFGRDLPPGVSVNMIPGNRPEDEAWENLYNNFWDKERLTKTHIGVRITEAEYDLVEKLYYPKAKGKWAKAAEVIDNYIMAAIEYGIEIGNKESQQNQEQNRFYESCAIEEVMEKDGVKQETIDKVAKILKGDYETP